MNATDDTVRDYVIKSGDEYLVWSERGSLFNKLMKGDPRWTKVGGHLWQWSGMQQHATRFTWSEARDVVWNKLKTLNHDGLGNPTKPPRTDRWRYKLTRLVPKSDTIRPAGKR